MAFLIEAYHEDEAPNAKGGVDKRVVLKLDPRLAPRQRPPSCPCPASPN